MQSSQKEDSSMRKFDSGNVILVGMMGSGKTTMGRVLAKQLDKEFVDSDEEIQHRTGVTIPHIFDVEGEQGFRQRESSVIADLLRRENLILATGGGAVLMGQNRAAMRENGIVIYLKASVHDLWQRTRHDRNRPLLQTDDPHARLAELFQQRDALYQQVADIVIQSGKLSVYTLMLQVVSDIEEFKKTGKAVQP
jgi:shikimate kinase